MKKYATIISIIIFLSCKNKTDKPTALDFYEKIGVELFKARTEVKSSDQVVIEFITQVLDADTVNIDLMNKADISLHKTVEIIESSKKNILSVADIECKENVKKSALVLLDKILEIYR